jgi:hypothetical protein
MREKGKIYDKIFTNGSGWSLFPLRLHRGRFKIRVNAEKKEKA